jgi:hypothetical protein
VTLSVTSGTLTILTNVEGGLTAAAVTENGSASVTLSGSQNAIDTTLSAANGVVYQSNLNFTGSDTLTMVSKDGSGPTSPQSTVAITVNPALDPHLWATVNFPAQATSGIHLFNPDLTVNTANALVALGYTSSSNYNPANPTAPQLETEQIAAFDPFFLPQTIADPVIETASVIPPSRYTVILPSIQSGDKINAEAIIDFVNQNASGDEVINQTVISGGNNNDSTLNITPPAVVENAGQGVTIYNLRSTFQQTNAVLSGYALAWDQYNSAAQTFSINFQTFNADGSQLSSLITPVSLSNVASITAAPAWIFGNGMTVSNTGSYLLGVAVSDSTTSTSLNLSGPHQALEFQGYSLSGAPSSLSFVIEPDLHLYAPGATNQIVQEAVPTLSSIPGGPSSALAYQVAGSNYAVAWNETVTDTYGTHDQVEFVLDNGSSVISRTTFQIADGTAQNVRLGTVNLGGQLFEVLAYGDNTATDIVEFNATTGAEVASIVDPTTQAYSTLAVLGDGRIAIGYDEPVNAGGTSQYTFKIFDLRTTGININDSNTFTGTISGTTLTVSNVVGSIAVGDSISGAGVAPNTIITASNGNNTYTVNNSQSVLSESMSFNDGEDKFIAGTHYNDTFVGENNVTNAYYFVGAVGTTPSDTFTGGQDASNFAIFPDAISNYTISAVGADGSFTVTNVGDPLHTGSLEITGTEVSPGVFAPTVQVLEFGPSKDPTSGNGVYEASAGTLYVAAPLYNPVIIDSDATAEFSAFNNGFNPDSVTFVDTGGTLKLDAPSATASITGSISGNVLTVSAVASGSVAIGDTIIASNVIANTTITGFVSGTDGGVGSYTLSSAKTVSSETLTLDGTGAIILDARQSGTSPFDFLDLANTSVASASVSGTTLTVNLTGGGTQTYQVIGQNPSVPVTLASDGSGGTILQLTPVGSLWESMSYPAQPTSGVHLYGPSVNTPQGGSSGDLVGVLYGDTTTNYSNAGPDTVSTNLATLDPFLLPYASSTQEQLLGQPVSDSTYTIPAGDFTHNSRQLDLASVSATQTEGLGFFVTEDSSGNATINQFTFTQGTANLNGSVSISTPTAIESGLIGSGFEYDTSFTNNTTNNFFNNNAGATGASYGLAWGQYNSSTTQTVDGIAPQTFTAEFQLFTPAGAPEFATPITLFSAGNLSSETAAPAWYFRSAGSATVNDVTTALYGSAISTLNVGNIDPNAPANSDFIEFQAYRAVTSSNGAAGATVGSPFAITPNLTAFAPGATDQITEQASAANHTEAPLALEFVPNVGTGSGYSIAWNDIVTDSNGTHDQVEFAIFHPSTSTLSFQTTFQIADNNPQNVRLITTTINGVNVELLAYGDNNGTHVVEFDSNGNELASIFDPTDQTFGQFVNFGDGRIALVYDTAVDALGTTQYVTDIYDLRTSGLSINDSSLADGQDKYIAGTQFADTFVGENNVNNIYYYVGQNTTGTGPTDSFTGGSGTAWNVAIFPDARSDYSFPTNGSPVASVASNGDDPAHTGSLAVSNVQFLAFDPASDPTPQNNTINVNGGTFVILEGNIPGSTSPAAITIEAGATAEIDTGAPYSGLVTFEASTGTLVLDQPNDFNGTIAGIAGNGTIAGSAVLDLAGFNFATTTATSTGSFNGTNTILTVTDSTTHQSVQLTLVGNYSANNWTVTSDGNGGADIFDPPATVLAARAVGTTGKPINLALANPPAANGGPVTVTVSGLPSDAQLNEGTSLGNGSWSVQTDDLTSLTVLTAFVGAMVLNVTESWANANGTIATATIADNVEAHPLGTPILALPNDETVTGAGGNDLFVFGQPIGNDTIHNFNVASDQIDLMGFANVAGFQELQIADDGNGDAVITVASGETITLPGIDATTLTASNFVFDQTPTVSNSGTMVVSDGAVLPLSGIVDNSGVIALNSTGDLTEIVIVGAGATLEGGGQIVLSGDSAIVGSGSSTILTNVDNTISGIGQIGMDIGNLSLVNEAAGIINADIANGVLTIDTGNTIINNGMLEASNGGTLHVQDAVIGGAAVIAGGTMEFDAASSVAVSFDNGAAGTNYGALILIEPAQFSGSISGFTGIAPNTAHSDAIDLIGINFNSSQFSDSFDASTGVLTLTDGTNTDSLKFIDFNGDINNFSFAEDASDKGILITDPPDPSGTDDPAEHNTGLMFDDTFVFHPSFGEETGSSFNTNSVAEELQNHANTQREQGTESTRHAASARGV